MKLSKTKKILLLGTTLAILTTSIVVPIVVLNKNESKKENDVEKLFKILQAKTNEEKIIELSSSASGKIIANNQDKIIEKIKTLIGKANLKEIKIEVSMKDDSNISTTPQKIIIKLTKNEISKEIKDFLVKKKNVINEDIIAIKKILDSKVNKDLIINLPSTSSGSIINKLANKNEIERKIRILIDPSNTGGDPNHASLRGTTITLKKVIFTPPQNDSISIFFKSIIITISKTGGNSLDFNDFVVRKKNPIDEDIEAIKKILDSKVNKDLIINLPSTSSGSIINKLANKNEIERKIRILINPSNTAGDPNHSSLRGTTITLKKVIFTPPQNDSISIFFKSIIITISKTGGTSLDFNDFVVRKLDN